MNIENRKFLISLLFNLYVIVIVLVGITYFFQLGKIPLIDRDEGEYSAVVNSMINNNDFFIPRLNGQLYLEKPILFFLVLIPFQIVNSLGEMGARLPSSLSAFLVIFIVGWLVMWTSGDLLLSLLVSASVAFTPLMVLLGRLCITDMLLTLFTTLSLGAFFLAMDVGPMKDRFWYLIAWIALSFGFLTKGPVAVVIILSNIYFYAILQRKLWITIRRMRLFLGGIIFIAINLPWYGFIFYKVGDFFWQSFFISQNLQRFREVLLGHSGGEFYYLLVIFLGGFPFSVVILPNFYYFFFKKYKNELSDSFRRLCQFSSLNIIIVFIIFTLASTKQVNYILPVMPFIGLLGGYFLWRILVEKKIGYFNKLIYWCFFFILSLIWLFIFFIISVGLPWIWELVLGCIKYDSSEYALSFNPPLFKFWPVIAILDLIVILVISYWLQLIRKVRYIALAIIFGIAIFSIILVLGIFNQAVFIIQEPARLMALTSQKYFNSDIRVFFYGLWKPSLLYYFKSDIVNLKVREFKKLEKVLNQERLHVLVLTRLILTKQLKEIVNFYPIKIFDGYILGGGDNVIKKWRESFFSNEDLIIGK